MIPYLLSKGHKVLNLDLIPFPDPSVDVYTLKTDLSKLTLTLSTFIRCREYVLISVQRIPARYLMP